MLDYYKLMRAQMREVIEKRRVEKEQRVLRDVGQDANAQAQPVSSLVRGMRQVRVSTARK